MQKLQVLPLGEASFKVIRNRNWLYVDKTRQIHQLLTGGKYYFLSRPRRFGKSLLLTTLNAIFEGRKELFEGLWIGEHERWTWEEHPVILLSFNGVDYRTLGLEESLKRSLKDIASDYDLELENETIKSLFSELIQKLYEKQGAVAVLIDEYDKPIIDFIDDFPKADANRETLKEFFSVLKDLKIMDALQMVFITGVSKFSKVSIFSDLNNLTDLTLDEATEDLLGITKSELKHYFRGYLEAAGERYDMDEAELLTHIKAWYDGYSWNGKTFVYNPHSLMNFLRKREFENYWFQSGTPSFLVKRLKRQKANLSDLENLKVTSQFFNKFELKPPSHKGENLDVQMLLFQTGYLTVKKMGYDKRRRKKNYYLGYPNLEVKGSFLHHLLEVYSNKTPGNLGTALEFLEDALINGDTREFIEQLKVIFADISHHLLPTLNKKEPTKEDKQAYFKAWEGYFQTVIYLTIKYIGLHIDCEVSKHQGRMDAKIEVDDYLYIIEFKLGGTAKVAMTQIKEREYAASFRNTSKQIVLIGICFDNHKRNVSDWEVEVLGN